MDIHDGIALLTLNRPEVLNAINLALIKDVRAAVAEINENEDVRAMVWTGAGRGFCSGADLSPSRRAAGDNSDSSLDKTFNALMRDLYNLRVPTIAAVNGVTAGGGCGLALVADITLAARSVDFILLFTRQLGLIPDMGVTWFTPRLVGRGRAAGLAMLGERLAAKDAEDWGLIWKCVDDEALMDEAMAIAEKFRDGPTLAFRHVRFALDAGLCNDFPSQLAYEAEVQEGVLQKSEDYPEGVKAFLEKRKPQFRGR